MNDIAPDEVVGIVRAASATYDAPSAEPLAMRDTLRRLGALLGWASPTGGPLGALVKSGARVLIKPNWVLHRNLGPYGTDELITNASLVKAAAEAALAAGASRVAIGDSPVQGCDFEAMLALGELRTWAAELSAREPRFAGLFDFRRTTLQDGKPGAELARERFGLDEYVLFDLRAASLLEPITRPGEFRVTMYPPELMAKTHAPGRHQFLVAREIISADVVINLPKLKTHKKAGITNALKNLIGINGNKEFLPHHRVGGAGRGGDCYPGGSRLKRLLEWVLDQQNASLDGRSAGTWAQAARVLDAIVRRRGDRFEVEGSWSGNDTIWRTCLDLNRILLYGKLDATLGLDRQRTVVNIVDAVLAGHGNGPLSPEPFPLGLVLGSTSSAAMDWVGAELLGYDPAKIATTREAFGRFAFPLADFSPDDVRVRGDLGDGRPDQLRTFVDTLPAMNYPIGWVDCVRRTPRKVGTPTSNVATVAEPSA